MSVSINKVLLEHSHVHFLVYCLWLLHALRAELGICDRVWVAHNAENIYSLDFYRSFPTPGAPGWRSR